MRVVSRRSGNQAFFPRTLIHRRNLIVSAAHLVGAGLLQILRLKVDLVAALLGKEVRVNQLGFLGHLADSVACLFKSLQCHRFHTAYASSSLSLSGSLANSASTYCPASNFLRSSIFSPTPMYLTGSFNSA